MFLVSHATCPLGCRKASCPHIAARGSARVTRVCLSQTPSKLAATRETALTLGECAAGSDERQMCGCGRRKGGGSWGLKDPSPLPGQAAA